MHFRPNGIELSIVFKLDVVCHPISVYSFMNFRPNSGFSAFVICNLDMSVWLDLVTCKKRRIFYTPSCFYISTSKYTQLVTSLFARMGSSSIFVSSSQVVAACPSSVFDPSGLRSFIGISLLSSGCVLASPPPRRGA